MKPKYLLFFIAALLYGCERYETYTHQFRVTHTDGLWASVDNKVTVLDTTYNIYKNGLFDRSDQCFIFRDDEGVVTDSLINAVIMDMSYKHRTKIIKMKNGDIYSFQRLDSERRIGERMIITGPAKQTQKLKGAPSIHLYRIR